MPYSLVIHRLAVLLLFTTIATTLDSGATPPPDRDTLPAGRSAEDYGIRAGGTPDGNSRGFSKLFAATGSPTVKFSQGIYDISCSTFVAASSVSLIGAGIGKTIIKFPAGCKFGRDVFLWISKSRVKISDLTVDLNGPTSGSLFTVFAFQAYAGDADQLEISHVEMLNGISPIIMMGVSATGGSRYSNVRIRQSRILLAAAAPTQNQCIAMTTNDGAGEIPGAQILNNVCIGSGIQADGVGTKIIRNDVSGYRFGTGIFTAFNVDVRRAPTSVNCIIARNVLHDTLSGFDINGAAPAGIENNCYDAVIANNVAYNLGGAGFFNYASGVIYENNLSSNNGKSGSRGVSGILDQAGFSLNYNGTHPAFMSRNVRMIGNVAYDDRAGTQAYGYAEGAGHSYNTEFEGNRFSGSIQSMIIRSDASAPKGDRMQKRSRPYSEAVAPAACPEK